VDCAQLTPDSADYPRRIADAMAEGMRPRITARGNLGILRRKTLALFCSVRCPGNVILRTYDLACALRDARVTVVGGFHSPMERECLALLLRGAQPAIVCLARGIEGMRLPGEWRAPLEQGRLLVLSPFDAAQRRVTADTAQRRNRFVAALADEVLVTYAAPGGKTERFCRDLLGRGQPISTFEGQDSASLVALGATATALSALLARYNGRDDLL
jgi:predicted Rossmann fold nucleotide-binding protein DprA/Smf involved in DNA uptake